MLVIFNLLGFCMLAIIVGAGMCTKLFSENIGAAVLTMCIFTILCTIADFILRMKAKDAKVKLIHPKTGGHFFFIPFWIVGIALSGLLILGYTKNSEKEKRKQQRLQQQVQQQMK